jgi:hypothetical protein
MAKDIKTDEGYIRGAAWKTTHTTQICELLSGA